MRNLVAYTVALLICMMPDLAAQDSVIVVKGQVSDYYITVTKERIIEGVVTDSDGTSLEGATVMFNASPIHCNTDAEGRYKLKAGGQDNELFVYYPGMAYKYVTITDDDKIVNIRMEKGGEPARRQPTQMATPWFDPSADNPSTYCNPMNISYAYRAHIPDLAKNGSFRSTADPMIITYKDEYLLFSTNQFGFFHSKDLINWEFTYASFQRYPRDDDQCAPAAFVRGDTLFYIGSTYRGLPVWYSTDPMSGRFKRYVEKTVLPSWDPALFEDDDGRLYLYYGSSNEYALKGVELDRHNFSPISKIHEIMALQPAEHGWERFGMNNDDSTTLAPFTEGSYITKHNGKYFFQYGAPGTEFKVYADGVYVSDSPLGPFTYQKHNPMSYKPGGYVQGAGHGGTFSDFHGNYWHVATCMISLKYKFERRIGLYPAAFDADNVMYSATAFGDYPTVVPAGALKDINQTFMGWMLLSYGKPVTVSSVDSIYVAGNACDESMRTFWAARSGDAGEWLQIDLEKPMEIRAIQVNYYDHKAVQFGKAMDLYHQYRIFHSDDGKTWQLTVDKSDNDKDVPHDYIELKTPLRARFLKIVNEHTAAGNFALSGFRVFGNGGGQAPATVQQFKVARSQSDRRNARISWASVNQAYGYNIYYGTAPDKMYNAISVLGETTYDFRGLDRDTEYFFAIEALSENGRSRISQTINTK